MALGDREIGLDEVLLVETLKQNCLPMGEQYNFYHELCCVRMEQGGS